MSSAGKKTLKERVTLFLKDSKTVPGKITELLLLGINLFACFLFVYRSYVTGDVSLWVNIGELTSLAIFAIEYMLRIWITDKKKKYILSFYGIIDLISILPLFLYFIKAFSFTFISALKILRVLRFIRFLESETFFFGKISPFQLQVARTLFTIFTLLFVFSGLIMISESNVDHARIKTFGEAFYYCVITLSTVGYGDYTPITAAGRTLTVILILGGAILVPWQAGKLVRMLIVGDESKNPVTCPDCGLKGHDFDAVHCKACGALIYQEYEGNG